MRYINICHHLPYCDIQFPCTVVKSVTIPSINPFYNYLQEDKALCHGLQSRALPLTRTLGSETDEDRRWDSNLDCAPAHPPFLVALRWMVFGKRISLMEDEKPIVYKQREAQS